MQGSAVLKRFINVTKPLVLAGDIESGSATDTCWTT